MMACRRRTFCSCIPEVVAAMGDELVVSTNVPLSGRQLRSRAVSCRLRADSAALRRRLPGLAFVSRS